MKNYKTHAITFGILAGILLIALVIVGYKYMQLRKSVAKVATKTTNPTVAATSAAIDAINQQAALI